jgi:tRNA A37 threonylcarbamoyladenosine synthetase subunit TsaC/SUA5/YrdC
VSVYLCEETPLTGTASTVVDLAHGAPSILREGSIGERTILELLAGS